jgi:large subunit ribosomal protein L4
MASENLNARVFDGAGKEKGALSLNAGVFGGTIKVELLHGMVRWQRAKRRAGTHDVLTRSEIKGGKRVQDGLERVLLFHQSWLAVL